MKLYEVLQSEQSKKKYRELAKKYHTDTGKGDEEKIRKINLAKDSGDEAINKLYDELMMAKSKDKKEYTDLRQKFIKRTGMTPEEWKDKVHSKIKKKRAKKQAKVRKEQRGY